MVGSHLINLINAWKPKMCPDSFAPHFSWHHCTSHTALHAADMVSQTGRRGAARHAADKAPDEGLAGASSLHFCWRSASILPTRRVMNSLSTGSRCLPMSITSSWLGSSWLS